MRHLLIAFLCLGLSGRAAAQEASIEETRAVTAIVECLVEGVPDDWARVRMLVELEKPGADTGSVVYQVARADAPEEFKEFEPCDVRKPARLLLEARNSQSPERRGWNGARLLLQRDGKFGLSYDYPKAN
jgi:hypothetical protein